MDDKFAALSKNVEQSSRLIGFQLQSIDSSLLSAFISLIVSFLLSESFGLLLYWIPVSFFLMLALFIVSLVSSVLRTRKQNKERVATDVTIFQMSKKTIYLRGVWFKNAGTFFKAISIIFLISLIVVMVRQMGIIGKDVSFSVVIPVISSLLFLTLPVLNNSVIGKLERTKTQLDFTKVGCLGWLLTLLCALVYIGALFALPIWSLVILRVLYVRDFGVILPILVVIFLQVVTTLIFMNYFSAISVKKEMTIALFNLSSVQQRINESVLNQDTSDEVCTGIKEGYLESKRYEISADDTLLVNFYSFAPNPAYLSLLSKK